MTRPDAGQEHALRSGAGASDVYSRSDHDEMSMFGLVSPLLRQRFLVLSVVGVVFFVVAVIELVQPRSYSVAASFMPQSRIARATPSGLAAQLGLTVSGGEASQSPAFYVDLLKSREILGSVVETRYSFPSDTGTVSGTLIQIFRIRGREENAKREAAIRQLRASITASAVQRTGVVNLTVKARYAPVAEQIARQMLDQLNRFNLESRQSQAAAERRFTERRLEEVKGELRAAEDRLQSFLQRNRDYRNSPELTFQQDRLARDVAMRQQLYTTLSQAYEQAKIEEVRDTPVITVIEQPEPPVRPEPRGLIKNGLLALIVGLMLGVFLAFGREFMRNTAAEDSEEFQQFAALKNETLNDLKHPLRAIRRVLPRR